MNRKRMKVLSAGLFAVFISSVGLGVGLHFKEEPQFSNHHQILKQKSNKKVRESKYLQNNEASDIVLFKQILEDSKIGADLEGYVLDIPQILEDFQKEPKKYNKILSAGRGFYLFENKPLTYYSEDFYGFAKYWSIWGIIKRGFKEIGHTLKRKAKSIAKEVVEAIKNEMIFTRENQKKALDSFFRKITSGVEDAVLKTMLKKLVISMLPMEMSIIEIRIIGEMVKEVVKNIRKARERYYGQMSYQRPPEGVPYAEVVVREKNEIKTIYIWG